MLEVYFYHLIKGSLEEFLVNLLTLSRDKGWRALLCFSSEETLNLTDQFLWKQSPPLVHGTVLQDFPEDQPILLSLNTQNINRAEICFLFEGAAYKTNDNFKRIVVLFDGFKQNEVENARAQWQEFKLLKCKMNYYKQNSVGKWELTKEYVEK